MGRFIDRNNVYIPLTPTRSSRNLCIEKSKLCMSKGKKGREEIIDFIK